MCGYGSVVLWENCLQNLSCSVGQICLFIAVQIPGPINQFLRDYQRDGVQFLYDQYRRRVGGLLCDDMGLGKTVQVRIIFSVVYYAKLM